jgi:hypothetical protein
MSVRILALIVCGLFEVRKAMEQAGRSDLIGGGCDALIPAHPPKGAIEEQ